MTLCLDSGVVGLTVPYNPISVSLSSMKSLFFKGIRNDLRFLDHIEA